MWQPFLFISLMKSLSLNKIIIALIMIEQATVLLGHDTASLGKSNLCFQGTQGLDKASRGPKR